MLRGDGTLQGWTVVNQIRADDGGPGDAPLPMDDMPNNFFGVKATPQGGASQEFALVSPQTYTSANVALPADREAHVSAHAVRRMQTLPGIKGLTVVGKYPIAEVSYDISGFPIELTLEATSPLIPNDAKNSSLPCAVFTFSAHNPGTFPVQLELFEAQMNFVGWDGQTDCTSAPTPFFGGNVNTAFDTAGIAGMSLSNPSIATAAESFGTIAVSAVNAAGVDVSVIRSADSEDDLWTAFTSGAATPAGSTPASAPTAASTSTACAVVQSCTVAPGATATLTFILSWNFPNRGCASSCGPAYPGILPVRLGNMYNNWYSDAVAVATYLAANSKGLLGLTRAYTDTLFGSSIPPELLDTAAGRLATMRSGTMFWTEAGIVLGTEGNGCCPLNCSHVYGYTTMLERLFPELAKDMRVSDFVRNYDPATGVTMRFKTGGWAIDGALASVIKTYLVVRQDDPDAAWLPTVWPNLKAQMEIIMSKFDDGTGVIRVAQQNTYDTAMYGANTFIGSYYVTALRASAAMAILMNDSTLASTYAARAVESIKNYEQICWREDYGYYIADVTIKNCKFSYGPGCFVDQLCGIGLSGACGLGHIFDPAHEARARHAITTNNIVTCPPFHDLQKHLFDGDSGVTVCSYPNGRLGDGMQYETLVSSGFTSPVIAGCILDRNMTDASTIATDLRRRHDGRNRSPWNEAECGLMYSRAMAHWNIFDQCCGHVYDSHTAALSFDPRCNTSDFKCFFNLKGGWGQYHQVGPTAQATQGSLTLTCFAGSVELNSLTVPTLSLIHI
eukprot:TRINITY_DN13095_c0_g1_i1.p1 TRINITY_DN13095_c0_g1~~TRINITY_DN13095_c0_g1_i1.p1  ORF type:complete len:787 (+),score=161.65 TRINITY_DN13095_c0_g1_i1:3-2363(+)